MAITMKVGRNDPCPCGSGKKHKHCCAARAQKRADTRDSLAKGIFFIVGPLAAIVVVAVVAATLFGRSVGDDGLPRVWSAPHGHWHVVLPDGTETELKPGMVWDAEHGHFHQGGAEIDSSRRYVTDGLAEKIDEAEGRLAQ
jgi:hypothetical protein